MVKALTATACLLGLLFLLPNPAQAQKRNSPPEATLTAELDPPLTYYTVKATDPDNDVVTYKWEAKISCGTFTNTFDPGKTEVYWSHPNGPPPGCPHDQGTSHPGKVTVYIDDFHYTVACVHEGSESGTGQCQVIKAKLDTPVQKPLDTTTAPAPTNVNSPQAPPEEKKSDEGLPIFINDWLSVIGAIANLGDGGLNIIGTLKEAFGYENEFEKEKAHDDFIKGLLRDQAKLDKDSLKSFPRSTLESEKFLNPDFQVYIQIDERSAKFKKPGEKEFKPLRNLEIIPKESIVEVTKPVVIKTKTGFLKIAPLYDAQGNILENGVVEFDGKTPTLKSGGMEILEETRDDSDTPKAQTPNAELFIVQTHFTVFFNSKLSKTYVVVYEGEVSVKAKGKKETVNTSPTDKEPGVLGVSSKLSPVKIGLSSFGLIAILSSFSALVKRSKGKKSKVKKKF